MGAGRPAAAAEIGGPATAARRPAGAGPSALGPAAAGARPARRGHSPSRRLP